MNLVRVTENSDGWQVWLGHLRVGSPSGSRDKAEALANRVRTWRAGARRALWVTRIIEPSSDSLDSATLGHVDTYLVGYTEADAAWLVADGAYIVLDGVFFRGHRVGPPCPSFADACLRRDTFNAALDGRGGVRCKIVKGRLMVKIDFGNWITLGDPGSVDQLTRRAASFGWSVESTDVEPIDIGKLRAMLGSSDAWQIRQFLVSLLDDPRVW